jgi:hypothetical protein
MRPSLSTPSLLELLGLFERAHQRVSCIGGQRMRGVPAWSLRNLRHLSPDQVDAWTECIGYADSYPAPYGDDLVPVELEEDEDGQFTYLCPETFRTKRVGADAAAVRAVSADRLLNRVADLLDIPQAMRRGIDAPAIADVLWHLGKMRVGNVHVDVWLVRGLTSSVEIVFRHFEQPALPDMGVILTTGAALPALVRPPRNYRVVPMGGVMLNHSRTPAVDIDLVHRLLGTAPGEQPETAPPVRFDMSTNTLHISTRSVEPWRVGGRKQIAVVKYLVEQFVKGRRRVGAADILLAAHGFRDAARGKRVASIFSGNDQWLDYIDHDEEGYGIKLG